MSEDDIDSFTVDLSEFLDELKADNFEEDAFYLPLLDFCKDKLDKFVTKERNYN